MKKLNPQEKWKRLNNPQTLKDWGLSITLEELKTFPEGKKIAEKIIKRENL